MKRLIILVCALLAVCVGGCALIQWRLGVLLDDAHIHTVRIHASMEEGNITRAKDDLVALATLWKDYSRLLELVCDHNDIHAVKTHIIQAHICINYTDMEEFYSAVALIGENIEHIRDSEGLSLFNIL